MTDYYCYLIINEYNHTYIGITNNLEKRLNQHNKILKYGAKSTRKSNQWKYYFVIGLFSKSDVLRFEWYWKHKQNKNNKWIKVVGLEYRIKRLMELLTKYNNVKIIEKY